MQKDYYCDVEGGSITMIGDEAELAEFLKLQLPKGLRKFPSKYGVKKWAADNQYKVLELASRGRSGGRLRRQNRK